MSPPMKIIVTFVAIIFFAAIARAGSPSVTSIVPAAAQHGTEIEVVVVGARLDDARTLLFDQPGIEVVGVSAVEKEKFGAKLKVAQGARLGEYAFRAVTASGISDVRLFYVTPYPLLKETDEEKGDSGKTQSVPLGVTIYGSVPGEDQDRFEVDLKKGQRLSAEVIGVRLSSSQQQIFDPQLSIAKQDGTLLATIDDCSFTRQDPATSIIAPEDGKYRVTLREATNGRQGASNYLLHIGGHPRPMVAYPAGGQAGAELKVMMLGDAGGSFEQTVTLPAAPDSRFDLLAQKDGFTAPQPNFLRVADFPNVLEAAEPNNDIATATVAQGPLPLAFNGIIQTKDDVDFFKFSAKKGQVFDFTSHSREMRSPIDTVINIQNSKGANLAGNDDQGGPDSYLRWTAPEDGDFFLTVRDHLKRGGPLFIYRIETQTVKQKLLSYIPETVQNSSQERRAVSVPKGNRYATLLRVKRVDVGGDVIIESKNLPAGVTVNTVKMDKAVDTVPVVFTANADAQSAQGTFELLPKLAAPVDGAKVVSKVEHRVEVAENGNQRAYYGITEDTLAIAVTDEVPITLKVAQRKAPVFQNGSMNLKVIAERKNDVDGKPLYKGPIQIQLLYAPTGIGTPGTVTIPEGQNEGAITLSANGTAAAAKWKTCVIGSAAMSKGAVWISSELFDVEIAAPFVIGTLVRANVEQNSTGSMTLKLDQKVVFEGKAKVALVGLPQGITADEHEITKDDKEVKFAITADAKAQIGQHKTLFASFTLLHDGEPMSSTIASGGILRVEKPTSAEKIADVKK
jgi:hypothetical protein